MSTTVNQKALNSAAKILATQIKTLEAQGYEDMYFSAQFFSGGKKQNGIERGDVTKISKQVRDYVKSEEADTMNVEVFEESTSKSIYRKKFSNLYAQGERATQHELPARGFAGLGGYSGLGEAEVNAIVDKRVTEARRQDDFQRLNQEVETLRSKATSLEAEKEELQATLNAKKETEYYMGIIGAAFPGLAPLFAGTPLAQAANFLAGTSDMNGNALPPRQETSSETQSIATMVSEFCETLNTQEVSAVHLLFMAFEKDKNQIQRALQIITTQTPATA